MPGFYRTYIRMSRLSGIVANLWYFPLGNAPTHPWRTLCQDMTNDFLSCVKSGLACAFIRCAPVRMALVSLQRSPPRPRRRALLARPNESLLMEAVWRRPRQALSDPITTYAEK